MKIKIFFLTLILLLVSSSDVVLADRTNLALNPGFEEGSGEEAYTWAKYSWENKGEFKLDPTQKHSGQGSVRIINNLPGDSRYKQQIKVKGNSFYKLSCWIKTENVGLNNKGANLSMESLLDTSRDIKGTSNDWEYVELYGKTSKDQTGFTITLGVGGYGSLNTGKAWFDDVAVEELDSIPPGKTSVNLYTESAGPAGSGSNTGSNLQLAFLAAFIVILLIPGYFALKNLKNRRISTADKMSAAAHTGKNRQSVQADVPKVNAVKLKIDRKDIILMVSMTLGYLLAALINLGGFSVPNTLWQPASPGEYFIIDLGKVANVSRIYYYSGLNERGFDGSRYRVEYADGTGKFLPLSTIEKRDFYIWKYINVSAGTDRIKIIVDSPGGTLNEIGIFETGSRKPLNGIKIIEKAVDPGDGGTVDNLFDEQDTVEYAPSFLTGTYFDEIYHARTALEHLRRIEPFETTHPPLGKILIALGIAIFGMNTFGWRIIGTLFGAAMIPVMYLFGKKIFKKRFYAFCAAFLMMFDFMHFAQTRISTIDVYGTFFVILMYYYMYDYYTNKSYVLGFKQSLKPLLFCGLSFGIGAACKWIALYGAVGLAFLFFLAKYNEYKDYTRLAANKKSRKTPWINDFIPLYINATLVCCILFFLIIPGIIYILSYIPFMMVPGPGHGLKDVLTYQIHMYNYHSKLVATHPFSSPWWSWPLDLKPMWFYGGTDLPPGKASTIVSMGNPAIWWFGIPAVIAALIISVRERDRKMVPVFVAILFQYLPWIFVHRLVFIYHFFSTMPFVILTIVYVFKHLIEKYSEAKYIVYAYLGLAAVLFAMFYPVLSGMQVDNAYVQNLKWLKSWVF